MYVQTYRSENNGNVLRGQLVPNDAKAATNSAPSSAQAPAVINCLPNPPVVNGEFISV